MNTFEDFKETFQRAKARGVDTNTLIALERFESAIERDPNDAHAYATMGKWWYSQRNYRQALDHVDRALQIDGKLAFALCVRATLRATCPDAAFRDGRLAVRDAEAAIAIAGYLGTLQQDSVQRHYLRVLAAAYAEQGDFAAAVNTLQKALSKAITKKATRKLTDDLASYQVNRPLRKDKGLE